MADKTPVLPPPEVMVEIVRQTGKQLEVKQQELEIQRLELGQNFEYAKLALKAQAEDRDKQREHDSKQLGWRYIASTVVAVFAMGFLGYCLYVGKEKFAEEALKTVLAMLAGGVGGYSLGKSKTLPPPPTDPQKPD